MTSPLPSLIKCGSNVFNVHGSIKMWMDDSSYQGFPSGKSTATFPPTELSTCASKVEFGQVLPLFNVTTLRQILPYTNPTTTKAMIKSFFFCKFKSKHAL